MTAAEVIVEYLCAACGTQGTQSLGVAPEAGGEASEVSQVFCPRCGRKACLLRPTAGPQHLVAARL
jgi:DNA-directed RNA polymerase subunit RPC12/RpoP